MRENLEKSTTICPNYTGFLLPDPPVVSEKVQPSNMLNYQFIGYGLDCFGKFRDIPHLCLINQIGLKFTQEDQRMLMDTPDKSMSLFGNRSAATPSEPPLSDQKTMIAS